jgi:putative oxidoreductase
VSRGGGFGWFDERRQYAPLFIRLFAGTFLVYMSQDNVFSWERMREFEGFLRHHDFPLPLTSAIVSVGAQFVSGILFLAGALVRWAALVMVVNFLVALGTVHLTMPFGEALDPGAMLASALFLLFNGAGALSIDARWAAKTQGTGNPARVTSHTSGRSSRGDK